MAVRQPYLHRHKVREVRKQQEEKMASRDRHTTLTTAGQAGETTAPFQDLKQAPPEYLSLETRSGQGHKLDILL